jgi:hypothetical protein
MPPQNDNAAMHRTLAAWLVIACALAACSPRFNWREVRTAQGKAATLANLHSALSSRAAYFARGSRVFQAEIYTDRLKPEAAEPFFSGLKFE